MALEDDKRVSRCIACGVYVYNREMCERCYPKDLAA
jgi:uncharacterized OB-fold protein